MSLLLVTVVFGAVIGLVLGMLGGGGSILTVPVLVYLLQMDPHVAVMASLIIVGLNALMGSVLHWRAGNVKIKEAFFFGVWHCLLICRRARINHAQ